MHKQHYTVFMSFSEFFQFSRSALPAVKLKVSVHICVIHILQHIKIDSVTQKWQTASYLRSPVQAQCKGANYTTQSPRLLINNYYFFNCFILYNVTFRPYMDNSEIGILKLWLGFPSIIQINKQCKQTVVNTVYHVYIQCCNLY